MKMRILAASLCLLLTLTACGQQENTAEPETEPVQTPEYAFTEPDTAYDLDSAEEIVFSESETKVTVSKAGTYRVSGRCADGQLYVAAGKDGEVTLILDGLDLTSSTAPLVVEQAARVTVVLASCRRCPATERCRSRKTRILKARNDIERIPVPHAGG